MLNSMFLGMYSVSCKNMAVSISEISEKFQIFSEKLETNLTFFSISFHWRLFRSEKGGQIMLQ